ncbi:hypothetical protein KSP39_PZI009559 [Platanthera zijinensis]|uniref:Calmodulin binding protein-like N-terminal domain-containing protein n=1 Tax=Platanthera zijinensis TaxID=2320716 RepID=A0AAP0BLP4_9ASPA
MCSHVSLLHCLLHYTGCSGGGGTKCLGDGVSKPTNLTTIFARSSLSAFAETLRVGEPPRLSGISHWVPHVAGGIKVNFDGDVHLDPTMVGLGVIARDVEGALIDWRVGCVPHAGCLTIAEALADRLAVNLALSSSPKRIEGSDGRSLQLLFKSRFSLPIFTGGRVEGEQGASIHVVLIDANIGHVITSEPDSSAKLDIVVLEDDFNNADDEDSTDEEFENHVVKEREGKRPLLTDDLQVTLKEGVGTL